MEVKKGRKERLDDRARKEGAAEGCQGDGGGFRRMMNDRKTDEGGQNTGEDIIQDNNSKSEERWEKMRERGRCVLLVKL